MQALQPNTLLQGGRYKILKTLGQGGFGITYLAEQTMLDGKVAIKEFFMKELCDRDESTSHVTLGTSSNREMVERCRQKFLKEARTIFRLNHPSIVRILDVFEENGTAYYVMEYIQGESLADIVKHRGALPEAEAVGYVKEVGDALKYIHDRKMNHLDIKPSNLMRREEDGRIMLIDFGVSKQYDLVTSEGTSTTPVGISRGYSPVEQYRQHGVQIFSPQSDVYALAATLFKLLTGVTPPEAIEVQDEGLPVEKLQAQHVSAYVTAAIQRAMKSRRDRTQSVPSFLSDLVDVEGGDDEETVLLINSKLQYQTITPILETPQARQIFNVNGISFTMIRVEGGSFTMGATSEQWSDAYDDEKPTHHVTLSTYSIGETEVTQELWLAVMGSKPSQFRGAKHPVENVSWNDCQEFIKILSNKTGKVFRLPTEAEWEYAARGGKHSKGYKYAGSHFPDQVAWYTNNCGTGTQEVAKKQTNELGLYDMSGNVYEWCGDWYDEELEIYSETEQVNPKGPSRGHFRVLRGGSWNTIARGCRSSFRFYDVPTRLSSNIGFRLALTE